jgi:8-oxo-dGTP pyrophosphatase MutT (NUDIX family)
MIHETSAGIILFRQLTGNREYLLLHYPGGHFDFAKGHVEAEESEHETAFRELQEETGIRKIIWIEGFRHKIHYNYHHGPDQMSKDVIFFLARTTQKKVKLSHEHKGYLWLPYEEAEQQITFQTAKELLKKAEDFLKRQQ